MSDSELNEADEASLQNLWSLYKDRGDDQHPDVLAMLNSVSTAVRDRFISHVGVRKLFSPIAHRNFERLAPGDTIGSVEVLRKLRQGGTATVYQGIQSFKTGGTPATRDVVIKVMSPLNATKNQVEREANLLMLLNADPHIVNLYSVEPLADGTYAIVLELVQSGNGLVCSLQELLEFRRGELKEIEEAAVAASLVSRSLPDPLTPEFVVEWLRPVANALAFAHRQGALHRDLKPGNILIRKSKDGLQLLLADWAFGKLGESGVFADMTARVGTLRYMAPEVLSGHIKSRLARRTDIYSFGLMFKEMLTLKKPPLQTEEELELTCADTIPAAVRIPHDITTIIDRCVELVPECRAKSFDEIVRSFDFFLAGQPISIRGLTRLERLWYRIVASPVLAVGLLGTLIAALSVTVFLIRWNSWKHRVQEAAIVSRDSMNGEDAVYAASVAAQLYDLVADSDDTVSALALERFNWSRRRAPLTTSQFSWADQDVQSIRFDPTGKLLIAESKSGLKRVWNASSGGDAQPESSIPLTAVTFAADGRKAFAFRDGTVMVWPEPGKSERVERIKLTSQIDAIAFHPTQPRMAISHEGLLEWDFSNNNTSQITTSGRATHLEYSDENSRLLSLDKTGLLQVLDLGSTPAVQLLSVQHRPDIQLSSYFCSSGSEVVVLSGDSEAEYLEVRSGRILKRIVTSKKITSAAIMRSGITRLALGGDRWMSHYSSPYFTEEVTYTEHDNEITSLRWSEDAELILSASQEGSVRGWYPNNRHNAEWVIHLKQLTDATCDPAGRRVATLQAGGVIRVWELPRPWRSQVSDGFRTLVNVSPDGQYFVPSGSSVGKQKVSYTRVRAVGTTEQEMSTLPLFGAVCGAIFRPGNTTRQQVLFLMSSPNRLEFCEFKGGGQISECTLPSAPLGAAFSTSGNEAVVCLEDGSILVVDPDTGKTDALVRRQNLTTQWKGHRPQEWIAFAPDGQHFATWGLDDNVTIWNLAESKAVLILKHQHPCFHATFSKDGQYLAVAGTGGSDGAPGGATLWDTKTGDKLQTLGHRGAVVSVEFSQDSKTLLTASLDRSARLWAVETGKLKKELVHKDEIYE